LNPIIIKLKRDESGILNQFEAKKLEVVAKVRNDAAHGGEFNYSDKEIQSTLETVESILHKLYKS